MNVYFTHHSSLSYTLRNHQLLLCLPGSHECAGRRHQVSLIGVPACAVQLHVFRQRSAVGQLWPGACDVPAWVLHVQSSLRVDTHATIFGGAAQPSNRLCLLTECVRRRAADGVLLLAEWAADSGTILCPTQALHDAFIWAPNGVGALFGAVQLILIVIFPKGK